MKSFSCLQPHFGELCLGRGPESLQHTGEWFCCRGFRPIVDGRSTWRVESFVSNGRWTYWQHFVWISRPARQSPITYSRSEMSEKIVHKASEPWRACRTSRHKLAHCEGLATFGNRKSCCINHCMCPCLSTKPSSAERCACSWPHF